MVKVKESNYIAPDGTIQVEAWLNHAATHLKPQDVQLIRHACVLGQLAGESHPTLVGVSCLQQGLTMAEILLDLNLDAETIAAAIVYNSVHYAGLNIDDVRDHLGEPVAKLVRGTLQMDAIHAMPTLATENHAQLENVRKMLLAMVQDMRVVLIKLAERTAIMRSLAVFDANVAKQYAKETLNIYAPLANRLGIGQLKWELEDRSLRYIDPKSYHDIATQLHERRIDRENYIETLVNHLKKVLEDAGIKSFEVQGRAKHIYSIYRKMKRKKLSFDQLFDIHAVRILVTDIEDCYTALSIVHGLWAPISKEFDDYIATPKPNGYRSIHTAIIGPENKNVEIQIRTFDMHKESEHGVAAHWRYKEGGQQKPSYEAKIAWLRQVLAWQKDLTKSDDKQNPEHNPILEDRVYVFTPTGEVIELPQGSTPLDFAYQIHSEIGHRCRGAKINGTIVPLTYQLHTGDQIEILKGKNANPSRDWMNPHLNFLKTARAKAKVHHWFKLKDFDHNLVEGQAILDRELQRLNLHGAHLDTLAEKLYFKTPQDMLAGLGSGDLRIAQVVGALQSLQEIQKKSEPEYTEITLAPPRIPYHEKATGIHIAGVGNLLTHTARCCRPVPGEPIIGFITKGQGVAIHRRDCNNILNMDPETMHRLIEVNWGVETESYPVDILIDAYDRPGLVRDISTLLAGEKLNILGLTTSTNKSEHIAKIALTIEIPSLSSLSKIFDKLKHLPNIIHVKRQTVN